MTDEQILSDAINIALSDVMKERNRQLELWGDQTHTNEIWLTVLTEEVGEVARAILEHKYNKACKDNIEKELIQVAAVAIAVIQDLRRRS